MKLIAKERTAENGLIFKPIGDELRGAYIDKYKQQQPNEHRGPVVAADESWVWGISIYAGLLDHDVLSPGEGLDPLPDLVRFELRQAVRVGDDQILAGLDRPR